MLRKKLLAIVATTLTLASTQSFAAPADDAQAHFNAIASGNVAEIMKSYAANPHLEWVGGPLDGAYSSQESIKTVWTKFTTSQGPLKLKVAALEEAQNPKGVTVTANVLFEGKMPLKVRYVLTYRDDKIVNETWQIAPSLSMPATY